MSIANAGTVFPDPSVFPGDVTITEDLDVANDGDIKGDLDVGGTLNAGAIVVTGVDTATAIVDTITSHTTKDLRLETKDSGAGMTFASATGICTVDIEILVDDIKEKTGGAGTTINSVELKTGQINTGQGLTEVYPMDQPVTTASNVTFTTINTDIIDEKSVLAGVTIDNTLIKDQAIYLDDGQQTGWSAAVLNTGSVFMNRVAGARRPIIYFRDVSAGTPNQRTFCLTQGGASLDYLYAQAHTDDGTFVRQIMGCKHSGETVINDGTAAAPGLSFMADETTGIYRPGVGALGIAVSGVDRFRSTTADNRATVPFRAADGSAGVPAFSFTGDSNSGMYRIGNDIIGVSTAGLESIRFNTAGASVPLGKQFLGATILATPGYAFNNDATSGLYSTAVGQVGIATSAVSRLLATSTGVEIGSGATRYILPLVKGNDEQILQASAGNTVSWVDRVKSYGQLSMIGNVTPTTITTINTWTLVQGSYSVSAEINNFDQGAAISSLRYIGGNTRKFKITASLCGTGATTSIAMLMSIFNSGVLVSQSQMCQLISTGFPQSMEAQCIISIANLQTIDVRVMNTLNTDNFIISHLNMIISEL